MLRIDYESSLSLLAPGLIQRAWPCWIKMALTEAGYNPASSLLILAARSLETCLKSSPKTIR